MDRNVDDIRNSFQNFGWSDYTVISLILVASVLIGVHFRPQSRQKRNGATFDVREYVIGNGNLHLFPVSLSLIAGAVSSVGIIGFATEGYIYGFGFGTCCIGIILNGVFVHYLVLPVFYDLKLLSIYEYMELRFNRSLRLFGSISYCLALVKNYFY